MNHDPRANLPPHGFFSRKRYPLIFQVIKQPTRRLSHLPDRAGNVYVFCPWKHAGAKGISGRLGGGTTGVHIRVRRRLEAINNLNHQPGGCREKIKLTGKRLLLRNVASKNDVYPLRSLAVFHLSGKPSNHSWHLKVCIEPKAKIGSTRLESEPRRKQLIFAK